MAFKILPEDKLSFLSQWFLQNAFDDGEYEWGYYSEKSQSITRNLRHIFRHLHFRSTKENNNLLDMVSFLKESFQTGRKFNKARKKAFLSRAIPGKWRSFILDSHKDIIPDRYEFMVYRLLKDQLISGDIFIRESLSFKSFEEELVPKEKWKNKEAKLQSANLPLLLGSAEEALSALEAALEKKLTQVDNTIRDGEIDIERPTNEMEY